ncbi:hypothetical protein D9Q98_009999 [Chlorella vulgaris]|uniref:Uncharacterized protein n=1 Tax=Chlorella vulgaris TaxID=3077 RepID=A0A9D4YSQ1_CHLVU|nr:hypothetical protein D9Q98_009999 [Chlorella vulgaris]
MNGAALGSQGDAACEIIEVDKLFKVIFRRSNHEYVLGLFASMDESHRVCDVLTIKEAVDTMRDLHTITLHFDLSRYGVDNDTAGEIRSVSFRQVVRDLQVCAVQPLVPLDGPDTQATSWAAAGNSRFQSGMTRQRSEAGARAPSVPPRGGVGMLPPRVGGARRGGGSQMSIMSIGGGAGAADLALPSAARAAFHQAGAANEAATTAAEGGTATSAAAAAAAAAAARSPHAPPPRFAQQAPAPAAQQRSGQQQRQQQGAEPAPATQSQREQAGGAPRLGFNARKRPFSDEALEEGNGDAGEREREARQQQQHGGARRGFAAAAAGAAGAGDAEMADGNDGEAEQEQGTAGGAGKGWRGGKGRRDKRPKRDEAVESGERPWQSADVMAFTAANHPFHGISSNPTAKSKMFAQLICKMNGSEYAPDGSTKKTLRLTTCGSAAEAAVSWDLGAMWRAIQYGSDPAELEVDTATRRLNFSFERYAAMVPTLRSCSSFPELQEIVKSLRDEAGLVQLATAGSASGGRAMAAAAAAQPSVPARLAALNQEEGEEEAEEEAEADGQQDEAEEGEDAAAGRDTAGGTSGGTAAQQQSPAGRGGRRRGVPFAGVRGRSSLAGVYGEGPWFVQSTVSQRQVLASNQRLWNDMRRDHHVRVPGCTSDQVAGACSDLIRLWRCNLYGHDPAAAPLNFPLQRYAPLLPALNSKVLTEVSSHIAALRDAGSLQAVVAGGPAAAAAPAATPAAVVAPPPASVPASHRQAAAAAAAAAAETASPASLRPQPGSAAGPAIVGQAAAAGAAAAAAGQPLRQGQRQSLPAAAPAAGGADLSPAALLQRLQGMSASELLQAAYRGVEVERVSLQQAMYAEVEAAVEALQPDISAAQATAYMGLFVVQHDMRSLLYRKVVDWQAAGNRALLVQHVRSLLPADMRD